jgi:hypothetical protein
METLLERGWRRPQAIIDPRRHDRQRLGSSYNPNSVPAGSAKTANAPEPGAMSDRGVNTRPPAASIFLRVSGMSSSKPLAAASRPPLSPSGAHHRIAPAYRARRASVGAACQAASPRHLSAPTPRRERLDRCERSATPRRRRIGGLTWFLPPNRSAGGMGCAGSPCTHRYTSK